ncbi:DUF1848 family protein [Herbivorax sp. ANBcel31]|uniref:DUF1848 family protein n=1 Tax=Herbivorax sp. ANBcel31 TaxID=3069754 RepID=UPI0027B14AA5|nr:DUF1848 family protein [Herbivorax sp. ANBcel31]MDQ2087195.1 DUF1848 family protein [Herbivorax sp. ANBcel31]
MEQISLFEDEKKKNKAVILSASRMTDMPKYYPDVLMKEVMTRIEKGMDIHTVVFWTKHPDAMLTRTMIELVNNLFSLGIQCYIHCTITGMGGRSIGKDNLYIEPNAPKTRDALSSLPKIVDLFRDPLRVRLRIDPLVKIKKNDTDETFSNFDCVKSIIESSAKAGIKSYSISFLQRNIHKKVDNRFKKIGWSIENFTIKQKQNFQERIKSMVEEYGGRVYSCSVSGLEESRCIDGYLLEELHTENKYIIKDEPRKRKLCGCTHSIDIGGWPPKRCFTGCQYCYANSSYYEEDVES